MEGNDINKNCPKSFYEKYFDIGSPLLIKQMEASQYLSIGEMFKLDHPELPHPIWLRAGTSDI